ncbi:hypothetical protein ABL850_15455 [Variovorax paradoxus]|uniref:hypothetical protein n=1 Tax=Variovorax paradoxus TaxID=34073 RepID=UPI003AABCF6A
MYDRVIQLAGSFAAGALASGALLAFAAGSPPSNVVAPRSMAARPAAAPLPAVAGASRLGLLRNEAASGDELSNWQLSNALFDRYDASGEADDLYEALIWMERRRNASGNAQLIARVVDRYCGQRVVRWHWFCVEGE